MRIKPSLLSLEDGLPKAGDILTEVAERLQVQKDYEVILSHDNPRFMTSLKCSLISTKYSVIIKGAI